MALTKKQKIELGKEYQKHFSEAKNVVVVRQTGIRVNDVNEVRKGLFEANGEYRVVKKRVLLKSLEGVSVDAVEIDQLEGSVAILCAYDDEYAPLKVLNDSVKRLKAAAKKAPKPESAASFEYVGGWFDGKWFDADYVSELANIPSQEELISKLLYLIKYPLQGFAMALSEIAKKGDGQDVKVGDLVVPQTKSEESEKSSASEEVAPASAE